MENRIRHGSYCGKEKQNIKKLSNDNKDKGEKKAA
jgi:hypothetical protein